MWSAAGHIGKSEEKTVHGIKKRHQWFKAAGLKAAARSIKLIFQKADQIFPSPSSFFSPVGCDHIPLDSISALPLRMSSSSGSFEGQAKLHRPHSMHASMPNFSASSAISWLTCLL